MNSFMRMMIAIVLIGGFFMFGKQFVMIKPGTTERLTSYVVYPVLLVQHTIIAPVKRWFDRKQSMQDIIEYAEREHHHKELLLAENIELQALHDLDISQQSLKAFAQRYKSSTCITAQVLLKNFSETAHFFLVDAGKNRGVVEDMIVIYKNCLLGRVVAVYPYYAKVQLITDRLCQIAGFCSSTKARGIHQGINTVATTMLHYVSHLDQLKKGDLILSSGEGLIFPRGFGLGRIKDWQQVGFQYEVEVEPLLDFHTIDYCLIIQKGAEFEDVLK